MMQRSTLGIKKNSTHKRNTREEIKRKLEVRDWTERKVHEKLISIGSFFFFVFSKKKICCSCLIYHLLPGCMNVLFQSETYGWWEKVKAEEKQNRSRIRDLHVCSFEIIKAEYKLPWTTHTFPFSEFSEFPLFPPDSSGLVSHCYDILGQGRFYLTLTIHDVAIN